MSKNYKSPDNRSKSDSGRTCTGNPCGSLRPFPIGSRARWASALFMLITILAGQNIMAQVASYTFAQTSGTFAAPTTGLIDESGATVNNPSNVFSTTWDDSTITYALPFTFTFDNTPFTSVTVSTNGCMVFGTSFSTTGGGAEYATTSNPNGVFISGTVTNRGVAAFNVDSQIRTGTAFTATRTAGSNTLTSVSSTAGLKVGMRLDGNGMNPGAIITAIGSNTITMSRNATGNANTSYIPLSGTYAAVTGSSPNRKFIMTFVGVKRYHSGTGNNNDNVDYQYILNEGTNTVQIVYGGGAASTNSNIAQVGLRGTTNTDFNSRTTTANWNSSTAGASNTEGLTFVSTVTLPASGLTFTWTPPVLAACVTPTALASSAVFSSVTTTTLSGSFTAASPAPSKYLVVRSTSATPPTPANGTVYTVGSTALGAGTNVRLAGNSLTFTDTGLTAGTLYYYHIFSYNDVCTGQPFYSATAYTASQATVCSAATGVSSNTITTTDANITWTGSGNFIVEYGPAGFTPGTGATAGTNGTIASSTATTPYALSGLSPATTYSIYVRQVCVNGGYSANSSVHSFTTACLPVTTFPNSEPFTSYPPVCWTEGNNGTLTAGPSTVNTTASDWSSDLWLNAGTNNAIKINIDSTGDNDWVITPFYTIPAGMRLTYNVAALQWDTTVALTTAWEADDFVELVYSTNMVNWTVLRTYNSGNVPSHLGQLESVDLSSLAGQTVHFAFRGVEGGSNGGADIDFMIDNFSVEAAPVVVPDCASSFVPADLATNVVRNGELTWTTANGALSYDVYFGTTATPAFVTNTTSTIYTPPAMLANTTYYWQIVPKNNVGDAVGCSIQSFATGNSFNYCTTSYSSGPGTTDQITKVVVGTMTNTSGPSSAPYYTFYNAVTVPDIVQGNNVSIAVTFGSHGTQYSGAWIDYNQNGIFEASEGVVATTAAGSNGTTTLVIALPANASLGNTRLRVRGGDDSQLSTSQACGASNSSFGETEDYIVNIIAPPAPVITSLGNTSACVGGSITINGTNLTGAVASGVTIGGTPVASITSNNGSVIVAVVGSGTTGTVSVTTAGGTADSPSPFTVNQLPVVDVQPVTPAVVCAGAGVQTITVTASGASTYQWRRNGVNLSNTAPFSGTDTATLTITNPAEANAGSYDVVVGTAAGCSVTSSAVNVNVNPAPPVTTNVTICQGGSGSLTASGSCSGFVNSGTTISGSWTGANPTALRPTTSISNTATCSFDAAVTRNYVATNFQVSLTGNYALEMNSSASFDGMAYLVSGAFAPGNCTGGGTWIKGDDDGGSGDEPRMTATLTAGVTYTLISTTYSLSSGTYTGSFGWTVTPPAGGQIMLTASVPVSWYTAASGGSPIATTNTFNPVGVAGSGITDTNTAGTATFYAACDSNDTCRTPATFTINTNVTYYEDADHDNFGNPAVSQVSCIGQPANFVLDNTDCNDGDNAMHQKFPFYVDADNDTYGTGVSTVLMCAVDANTPPANASLNNTDCDDLNVNVYQSASLFIDNDNDGYDDGSMTVCYGAAIPAGYKATTNGADCNDNDIASHQTFPFYVDSDNDGYGAGTVQNLCAAAASPAPAGYSLTNDDCLNSNSAVHPNATEIGYNLIDDDCDGLTDEGFPPKVTIIQGAQCNTTLSAIDSQIIANIVSGAQGYRWRITTMSGPNVGQIQFLDTALRVMKFTQLTNYAFATQYKVELSVIYAGFWQPYTASNCTISTPAATTVLSICGQTLTNMSDAVYANLVPYAAGYRFRITDPINGANTQVLDRSVRDFKMSMITNFVVQYGKMYNIEVAVKNTDGTYMAYSTVCQITTPVFPTTSLQDSQCEDYQVPTNSTIIYAFSYPGAISYVFQLTGPGLPVGGAEVVKSTRTFTLNDFAGQGVVPGASYNVKVRLIFNMADPAGPYGKTCTITTPGAARVVQTKAVFNAVAFPNPFAESFSIDVTTSLDQDITVKVYDMTGRLLDNTNVKAVGASSLQVGDTYPSGVYNVIITQGENVKTLRVVKR